MTFKNVYFFFDFAGVKFFCVLFSDANRIYGKRNVKIFRYELYTVLIVRVLITVLQQSRYKTQKMLY